MKDFADVPNSSGTFPDVVAVDCSGPGETDGTAIIADTLTDDWGWKQALLDNQGMTPDDAAETASASQILQALILLNLQKPISIVHAMPDIAIVGRLPSWIHLWSDGDAASSWIAMVNSTVITIPVDPPRGISVATDYTLGINPGAIRAGANRMNVGLYEISSNGTGSQIGSTEYDTGAAGAQNLVLSVVATVYDQTKAYVLKLKAGNTAGADNDVFYFLSVDYTF